MKRTNLVLDEQLLETATHLLGVKTYSAAVNKALEETIKMIKVRQLSQFIGRSVWDGNLAEMREDQPAKKSKLKKRDH
jgi:Arc/MetJ family transcription regulator